MRVLRGRAGTPTADRAVTARILERAATDGVWTVRVRRSHRIVAFGRRDAASDGYEEATSIAREHGFEPVERPVGGRVVASTEGVLSVAVAVPDRSARGRITDRYGVASRTLLATLREIGADVVRGEPSRSFCPGTHSIRVRDGGKIAGIAQRVRSGAALVSGCLVVPADDVPALVDVLDPVYDALDVPFAPASVGSLADAGVSSAPTEVARRLETALVDAEWTGADLRDPGVTRVERIDAGTDPRSDVHAG